ncbi:MAG: hypothetical protein LLG20_10575 [Acidobacteriales bacterium]|nr:hypothetical protein [Terriglobales bacterium]
MNEVAVQARPSQGVEQFFGVIRGKHGLSLVDFARVSQSSVSLITGLGHRIYFEDFIQELDATFGNGDFYANQAEPNSKNRFLRNTLNHGDGAVDGVLVWDCLEFLAPSLLQAVVERLHRQMKPGACLLALFHGEDKSGTVPVYSYRISDEKTLALTLRCQRKPAQLFNNRGLEKLFGGFQSVKFFLTRDNLREVIVRR